MKKLALIAGVLTVLLWAGIAATAPEASAEILECG